MRPDCRQPGFTLLEVLVALVIAALAMGVLFSGAVSGLRAARLGGHYAEALSRARSHLAAIGPGAPLVAGAQQGDDGQGDDGQGFRWRVQISPLATAPLTAPDAAHAPRIALYAVHVAISWSMDGGARVVELDSQRIGPAPAPAP